MIAMSPQLRAETREESDAASLQTTSTRTFQLKGPNNTTLLADHQSHLLYARSIPQLNVRRKHLSAISRRTVLERHSHWHYTVFLIPYSAKSYNFSRANVE